MGDSKVLFSVSLSRLEGSFCQVVALLWLFSSISAPQGQTKQSSAAFCMQGMNVGRIGLHKWRLWILSQFRGTVQQRRKQNLTEQRHHTYPCRNSVHILALTAKSHELSRCYTLMAHVSDNCRKHCITMKQQRPVKQAYQEALLRAFPEEFHWWQMMECACVAPAKNSSGECVCHEALRGEWF